MGDFLKGRYVAAWEKVGTFTLSYPPNGSPTKVGGNVAAYFCTPDLRVLGAAGGPVDRVRFLAEARRASALAVATAKGRSKDAKEVVAASHEQRRNASGGWNQESLRERGLYDVLLRRPLAPLAQIRREVFECVLGEKLSDAPVRQAGFGMEFEFPALISSRP